jgi:hypothetical protein
MPAGAETRTLRLDTTRGWTLVLAAVLLVAGGLVLEGVARLGAMWERLPPPTLGTAVPHLEALVARAQRLERREGPIDCIFVGDSTVAMNLDPVAFAAGYAERARRPIRCFNAAVPALAASHAGAVAGLFVQLLHPRLIVFGTNVRDFLPEMGEDAGRNLEASPWFRYRMGIWSVRGWLFEHSLAFRQLCTAAAWLDPVWWNRARRADASAVREDGFVGVDADGSALERPIGREADGIRRLTAGGFVPSPAALQGLRQLLDLRTTGRDVVVVEIPSHPTAIGYLTHGQEDRAAFIRAIGALTAGRGVPFWPAEPSLSPVSGWVDRTHMNRMGAAFYARALGRRVADAVPFANPDASGSR